MRSTLIVVAVLAGAVALVACGGSSSSRGNPAGPGAPTPTPIPNGFAFSSGQYLVGSGINSGRYFSNPLSGCYWERESGTGGTLGEILANQFIGFDSAQEIVDVINTDVAFKAEDCGDWFFTPRQPAQATIRGGRWLVGDQIAPGRYAATAADGCYWERLRGFDGTLQSIIANDFVSGGGPQLVSIKAGDVGFYTDGDCGTWTAAGTGGDVFELSRSLAQIESAWRQHRARTGR